MSTYALHASQHVPADLERVWDFFRQPANITRVMPRSVPVEVRTPDARTEEGALFEYRMRPLLGVPLTWRSRLEGVDPPHAFRDVQVKGPYGSWVHEHRFTAVAGGTRVDDVVEYRLPFGRLGDLVHGPIVQHQLGHIFRHRALAMAAIFEPAGDPAAARPGHVAVAGGTGFVGSAITRELRRRGRRVTALSSRGETARGSLPDDVPIAAADVRSGAGLMAALAGVDELVIALAFPGLPIERPRHGATFEAVDAEGTRSLLEAAREAGVRRVLYVSGAGAAHEATSHWFRAKAKAEDAVRASGLDWTILRPTWVYGPDDVSLNRFLGFARALPFIPLLNLGRQRLAPVFIEDVARLAADALEEDVAIGEVFEVGGPETMSMRQVIGRALAVAGIRRPLVPGPTPLIKLAAWPMRFLPSPPLTPDAVDFVNQPATVDLEPLMRRMPRRLVPLDEGLATYLGPTSASVTFVTGAAGLRPAA
jgi:nucleoside-diphosphate-sugar epimerase/ligand-binding SRPBCC domain-containing protein